MEQVKLAPHPSSKVILFTSTDAHSRDDHDRMNMIVHFEATACIEPIEYRNVPMQRTHKKFFQKFSSELSIPERFFLQRAEDVQRR